MVTYAGRVMPFSWSHFARDNIFAVIHWASQCRGETRAGSARGAVCVLSRVECSVLCVCAVGLLPGSRVRADGVAVVVRFNEALVMVQQVSYRMKVPHYFLF
jgi:hypothetical protein